MAGSALQAEKEPRMRRLKHWLWPGMLAGLLLCSCREKTPGAGLPAPAKPAQPGRLSARGAFALADPKARAWNAGALLVGIMSGRDISPSGASSYWEFRFTDPEASRKYVVVVEQGKVKDAEEALQVGKPAPLPADWIDSAEAYQKSAAEFVSRHSDHAAFERAWLVCSGQNSVPAHWAMLFQQTRHLPIGSMVDARTGDYLGELQR
ncbi:MAG: hypothetical protein A2V67_01235 [Deltaproteobacteria bacterium RBG_13_61_14]|nr:MAG: hypothetical protein A2V67_01235 [Deltaproteobacteria bacterium RBG_13_61_14]